MPKRGSPEAKWPEAPQPLREKLRTCRSWESKNAARSVEAKTAARSLAADEAIRSAPKECKRAPAGEPLAAGRAAPVETQANPVKVNRAAQTTTKPTKNLQTDNAR